MSYNIIDIDLSHSRIDEIYNLSGDSIKVINATSDCFIQFDDTSQDPINLLLVDEIKVKFTKFYISNVGVENKSIKIVVSENFNLDDRISITDYIKAPIPDPTPEPTPGIPFLPGFGFRIPITIPHTKVTANEVNCPIYIKLRQNNFDFTKARNDGFDVCFTKDDGTTILNFERNRHNNVNLKGDYMVKIPNISSIGDTKFFMYYGNPTANDVSNPTAVWDINYVARWSLKENPAGVTPQIQDSTIKANHGTTRGEMTSMQSIEGKIDKALNFDGVDDFIETPHTASLTAVGDGSFTISAWSRTSIITTATQNIIRRDNHRNQGGESRRVIVLAFAANTGNVEFSLWDGASGSTAESPISLANGSWHHLVAVKNIPNNNIKLYVNGVLQSTIVDNTTNSINTTREPYVIGTVNRNAIIEVMNGDIDEVRISNTARSASWINLQYQTQNNTLLIFGVEESV